ncbi:hypothetical protein [Nocardia jiangxiensis]|uniref:Uncharacterized protein n=1 Tax=Nocardia jiangxiensis TaxID=282685 RepID=A0ABW6S360_9NOCA|nr:hypothetical protein [Nocardia jiangxiensis]
MHRIAGWWDGFELWVAGLPFLPQFAVVLIGMVPISFLIAYLLDGLLREGLRMLGRDRVAEPEPTPPIDAEDPAVPSEADPESAEYGPHPLEYGPQPLEYGPPLPRPSDVRQKETV